MEKISQDRVVWTVNKWCPATRSRLHFPEDVQREILSTLARGRWWGWMPQWAIILKNFADRVEPVAKGCRMSREDLAQKLIRDSSPLEGVFLFTAFTHFGPLVPTWFISQAVEEWVFYDLEPALRAVISNYLDCTL